MSMLFYAQKKTPPSTLTLVLVFVLHLSPSPESINQINQSTVFIYRLSTKYSQSGSPEDYQK